MAFVLAKNRALTDHDSHGRDVGGVGPSRSGSIGTDDVGTDEGFDGDAEREVIGDLLSTRSVELFNPRLISFPGHQS